MLALFSIMIWNQRNKKVPCLLIKNHFADRHFATVYLLGQHIAMIYIIWSTSHFKYTMSWPNVCRPNDFRPKAAEPPENMEMTVEFDNKEFISFIVPPPSPPPPHPDLRVQAPLNAQAGNTN
jgi:hypothetical protein